MKSKTIILALLALVVTSVVLVASILTVDSARYNNDFVRVFPPNAAEIHRPAKFSAKHLSIAGISGHSVYIRSSTDLTELSLDMLDTCRIPIENPNSCELIIDSPFFYLHSGTWALLQRGNTKSWDIDTTYSSIPGFLAFQPINKNSFTFQIIDTKAQKMAFAKSREPGSIKYVLDKQVDGIFCSDGLLQYSKKLGLLVYIYRYRNQFLIMDKNLNVVRRGNTIDTTSFAKIEVSGVDGKITMSKPPLVVNKAMCVDGANLFVQSNLVAQNESKEEVRDRSVIDVYNIPDGSYRYSFYVFDQDNTKMRSFKVRDTILFAVFPNQVVRYNLANKYLKH
jgi:hypothetical protein